LRLSKIKKFKYDLIWQKNSPGNIALANKMPLKYHEIISVFYEKQPTYNKQMVPRDPNGAARINSALKTGISFKLSPSELQGGNKKKEYEHDRYDPKLKNPMSILPFKAERKRKHPTQKPVKLLEYLIKTYTNSGELVLDFAMGSGSTGVASKALGRRFIGIESNLNYFNIAKDRINEDIG
jgi:DNA modification methylase